MASLQVVDFYVPRPANQACQRLLLGLRETSYCKLQVARQRVADRPTKLQKPSSCSERDIQTCILEREYREHRRIEAR